MYSTVLEDQPDYDHLAQWKKSLDEGRSAPVITRNNTYKCIAFVHISRKSLYIHGRKSLARVRGNVRYAGITTLRGCRMAARSSKDQWRAFLFNLVEEGDINVLSPRQARAALIEQFGTDVQGSDRVWINKRSYSVGNGLRLLHIPPLSQLPLDRQPGLPVNSQPAALAARAR